MDSDTPWFPAEETGLTVEDREIIAAGGCRRYLYWLDDCLDAHRSWQDARRCRSAGWSRRDYVAYCIDMEAASWQQLEEGPR